MLYIDTLSLRNLVVYPCYKPTTCISNSGDLENQYQYQRDFGDSHLTKDPQLWDTSTYYSENPSDSSASTHLCVTRQ